MPTDAVACFNNKVSAPRAISIITMNSWDQDPKPAESDETRTATSWEACDAANNREATAER